MKIRARRIVRRSPLRTCATCGKRGRRTRYRCASCEAKGAIAETIDGRRPDTADRRQHTPTCGCGRGSICPDCWDHEPLDLVVPQEVWFE